MVLAGHDGMTPHLLDSGGLREWTFAGYGDPVAAASAAVVAVLTPPSVVRTIAAGFTPVSAPG